MTGPRWLPTSLRNPTAEILAIVLIITVLGYLLSRVGPTANEHAVRTAEQGYKVSLAAVKGRRAELSRDSVLSVAAHTASVIASKRYNSIASAIIAPTDAIPLIQAYPDSTPPLYLVGPMLPPLDSLVTLGLARAVSAAADTALLAAVNETHALGVQVTDLRGMVTVQGMALASADTVIQKLKADDKAKTCRIIWFWHCPTRTVAGIGGAVLGAVAVVLVRR